MASKLAQLQNKATVASQVVAKHACGYYKQLLEQNKHYIQDPATVEKCNELSKHLFYTRLARLLRLDSMIEKMKAIINAKEQDPEETFFSQVYSILVDRWNKMTAPLHLLAFALNSRFYSSEILYLLRKVPPYRDLEVAQGYKLAFSRLFPNPETEDMVMSEFGNFVTSQNHSLGTLRDKYKKDAHMQWYLHGHGSTYLQPLAIKVLSQVASSSSSEQN